MAEPLLCYSRREDKVVQEKILGDRLLRLAYSCPVRWLLGWPLFYASFCSRVMGWFADRPSSAKRIEKTVRDLDIDMDDYEIPTEGYRTFNEFFIRKLKPGRRPFAEEGFCSPADCRMTVFPQLTAERCIPVKGAEFTVAELLGKEGADVAGRFANGSLCVARLCPADYHRFHFPADGRLLRHWRIKGRYHTVSPIALTKGLNIFPHNVREVSLLDLGKWGLCAYIEVGAFGVASITQTFSGTEFRKGEEKGYFSFGGSTVILVFEPQKIVFAQDLRENSTAGREVILRAGDRLDDYINN